MEPSWPRQFRQRMRDFAAPFPPGGQVLSVKIRVSSGCFHREHSPHAYEMINDYLATCPLDKMQFMEHESGPEILLWLAAISGGITLTANLINLVTAIIRARSEGIKKGDHPSHPVELVIRQDRKDGEIREEMVLRFGHHEVVESEHIEKALTKTFRKFAESQAKPTAPSTATRRKKRRR